MFKKKGCIAIALRQFTVLFKSGTYIFLLFVVPLILFPFFLFLYSTGSLKDIPVAIYDADKSELSRNLIRSIDATKAMKIVVFENSINAIEKGIHHNSYKAAFYFPKNMETQIKKQHQVYPVFYKNAQNIIIASSLFKEAVSIFKTFYAGIVLKKIRSKGVTEAQAKSIVQPIITDIKYLYNSNFSYPSFLSPGFIFVQIQLILMLAGMLLFTQDLDMGALKNIFNLSNNSPMVFIVGKCIPLLIVFNLILFYTLFILFPLFHVYLAGTIPELLLVTELFLSASILLGIAFGAVFKNSLIASEIIIFINMPSMLFSGYTFPAMPDFINVIAQFLPFTHFMYSYFMFGQMNCSISTALNQIAALSIFVIAGLIVVYIAIYDAMKKNCMLIQ
jgi:ABC-2 type transport system permease protein